MVSYRDLCELVGREVGPVSLGEHLSQLGLETELTREGLKLEIPHNRPDLLSPEGVARALKGYLGLEVGLPKYELEDSGVELEVDPSVEQVRPYIVAGVIEGVKLSDEIVASLMQVQEKLHASLCRGRRKGSIGVYDLDSIDPPVRYTTVEPEGLRFVPLEFERELTPAQILREHPKGREYAHLLEGFSRYPLLVDSRGQVLSMPPIINSEPTRVRSDTRRLFVDVTGVDERVINQALVILMTGLAERGFRLRWVRVKYPNRELQTPDLRPTHFRLNAREVNELVGLSLGPAEVARVAERMRFEVVGIAGDTLSLLAPPYRTDLMHEVDLVEDIAVGYGYAKLEPSSPPVATVGKKHPLEALSERARLVMIGLGFTEAMTYTLTNPRLNFELMRVRGEAAEVANPVSEEYTILRTWLLPGLLRVLQQNRRNPLPQRVFEVGDVVMLDPRAETGARRLRKLAGVTIGEEASFTYIKAVVEAVLRELGAKHEVKPLEHPSFLDGRAAEVVAEGERLGIFGELHPEVILGFELEHPVVGFELELERIGKHGGA